MEGSTRVVQRCVRECMRINAVRSRSTLYQQTRWATSSSKHISSDSPAKVPDYTSSIPSPPASTQPDSKSPPTITDDPATQPFTAAQFEQSQTEPAAQPNQPRPAKLFTATVTRAGTMAKTVVLTRHHSVFHPFLQKYYTKPLRVRAHDPNPPNFLREGDIVEYGAYTQLERETKQARDLERAERHAKRLEEIDASGKAVRKLRRDEAFKKAKYGNKVRGIQFVVRRVVTPFGIGLEERMQQLGLAPPESSEGGQDSLLKGTGGNTSSKVARATVAG